MHRKPLHTHFHAEAEAIALSGSAVFIGNRLLFLQDGGIRMPVGQNRHPGLCEKRSWAINRIFRARSGGGTAIPVQQQNDRSNPKSGSPRPFFR